MTTKYFQRPKIRRKLYGNGGIRTIGATEDDRWVVWGDERPFDNTNIDKTFDQVGEQ